MDLRRSSVAVLMAVKIMGATSSVGSVVERGCDAAGAAFAGTDRPAATARRAVSGWTEWLLLAAAILHLWEVDRHGRAWWGYGAFFVIVVVGQAVYSLLLPRLAEVRTFLVAGVAGNVALLGLWAWTRSVGGVPIGPHRHIEPIGAVDGATMAVQLLAVLLLMQALRRRPIRLGSLAPSPPRPD